MHKSVLEPRKFDAELSAVPVKRLNLSIVFLIGDIQVSVTSYILQNSPVVGFRNNVLEIRITRVSIISNQRSRGSKKNVLLLLNLAPLLKPTQHKKVATKHAIAPWFGEGMRGGSLGLWWSLNGKVVALLSLEHLSCILREEIPVVGLFPALFFHVSEESSRSLPLMRG